MQCKWNHWQTKVRIFNFQKWSHILCWILILEKTANYCLNNYDTTNKIKNLPTEGIKLWTSGISIYYYLCIRFDREQKSLRFKIVLILYKIILKYFVNYCFTRRKSKSFTEKKIFVWRDICLLYRFIHVGLVCFWYSTNKIYLFIYLKKYIYD